MSQIYRIPFTSTGLRGGKVAQTALDNILESGSDASRLYRKQDAVNGCSVDRAIDDYTQDYSYVLLAVIHNLPPNSVLYAYCTSSWLFEVHNTNVDTIILTKDADSSVTGYVSRGASNTPGGISRGIDVRDLLGLSNPTHTDEVNFAMYTKTASGWRTLLPVDQAKFGFEDDISGYDFMHDSYIKIDLDNLIHNLNNTQTASPLASATTQTTEKGNTMSKVQNIVAANKSAAVSAAKLEAGRIALIQVTNAIKGKAPLVVRGYLDTPVGRAVVANVFSFAVDQYASNNRAAKVLSEAAMQAAALEIIQSFNIEQLITDVVNGVGADKLAALSAPVQTEE